MQKLVIMKHPTIEPDLRVLTQELVVDLTTRNKPFEIAMCDHFVSVVAGDLCWLHDALRDKHLWYRRLAELRYVTIGEKTMSIENISTFLTSNVDDVRVVNIDGIACINYSNEYLPPSHVTAYKTIFGNRPSLYIDSGEYGLIFIQIDMMGELSIFRLRERIDGVFVSVPIENFDEKKLHANGMQMNEVIHHFRRFVIYQTNY